MAAGQARSRRRPRFYPGPGSPGPAPRRNATDGPSARSPARSAAEAAPGRSSRGGNACSWSKTESDSLRKCHRLLRQAPRIAARGAKLDPSILTFDVSVFPKTLPEGSEDRRLITRGGRKNTDPIDLLSLLGTRRAWPCRRSAENCNENAPPHERLPRKRTLLSAAVKH